MKLRYFLSLCICLFTFSIFADEASDRPQPCMQIKKACESAGFQMGKAKEGKGLVKDCMRKITNGESVPGVKLSTEIINGCKEKHEK